VHQKLLTFFLVLISFISFSQSWQWSVGGGATFFKGDMQDWALNPSLTQMKQVLPSINLEIAYQESQSFNYRAQLMIGGLQGNSAANGWSNA